MKQQELYIICCEEICAIKFPINIKAIYFVFYLSVTGLREIDILIVKMSNYVLPTLIAVKTRYMLQTLNVKKDSKLLISSSSLYYLRITNLLFSATYEVTKLNEFIFF